MKKIAMHSKSFPMSVADVQKERLSNHDSLFNDTIHWDSLLDTATDEEIRKN